jgi:peroxiredoxin
VVDDIKGHILGHGCGTSGTDCGSSKEVFERNHLTFPILSDVDKLVLTMNSLNKCPTDMP